MSIKIDKIKLGELFDRLEFFHWVQFFLFSISLFSNQEATLLSFLGGCVKTILALVFFQFFLRTKLNLFYSFWSFSFVLVSYLIYHILFVQSFIGLQALYFLLLAFVIFDMYNLYSPIFYPKVHWWEYDFRYRHDFEIMVQHEKKQVPGILSDLRNKSGSVILFDQISLGDQIKIISEDTDFPIVLKGEILTRRQFLIGRPFNYGIRFSFENEEELKQFRKLSMRLKSLSHEKRQLKHNKIENSG